MLHSILISIYPDYQQGDWILQDDSDGEGVYIALWNRPDPQPTAEQIAAAAPEVQLKQLQSALEIEVQSYLDRSAKKEGFDSIYTACTYADEPIVPQFQKIGRALREHRSLVWAACYVVLNEAASGHRPVPTAAELIEALPEFKPPEM